MLCGSQVLHMPVLLDVQIVFYNALSSRLLIKRQLTYQD